MDALIAWMADCVNGISHWGTGGWMWMGLMMLAGVVLIVAMVYLLIKGTQGTWASSASPWHRETPLEIARRRYAAGEISKEEFDAIKEELSG